MGDSTMSSLQVDSISSMGGGHVDGAGKVVQCVYHQWNDITTTTSSAFSGVIGSKISFTPKFANSLLVIIYDFALGVEFVSGTPQLGAAAQILYNGVSIQPVNAVLELYTTATSTVFVRQTKINSIVAGGTSAADIELQFVARYTTGNLVTINNSSNRSNLLVQEIAQ
jgi:hypothetical protein